MRPLQPGERFGFQPAAKPVCPFDEGNAHFRVLRGLPLPAMSVGYEPEFMESMNP